jgi:hypothetical protein
MFSNYDEEEGNESEYDSDSEYEEEENMEVEDNFIKMVNIFHTVLIIDHI